MATSFMTNADYLDDVDTSALIAILRDAPNALSNGESCHVAKFANGIERSSVAGAIAIIDCTTTNCERRFWQNEAKMINVFKGACELGHFLPRPTRASCD